MHRAFDSGAHIDGIADCQTVLMHAAALLLTPRDGQGPIDVDGRVTFCALSQKALP